MTKPTTDFLWADNPTTLRTEPPEGTKDTGFAVNAKLPAQYFNWLLGICGDWLTWMNTRIFDDYTIPSIGSDCRLTGDPDTGLTVSDEGGDKLPVVCGDPDNTDAQMVPTVNWHDKYSCCVVRTTTLSMNSGDFIVWNFAAHDPSSMLDSLATETKITPGIAGGVWLMTVNTLWQTGTAGTGRTISVVKNASTAMEGLYGSIEIDGAVGTQSVSVCGIVGGDGDPLLNTDYFRVQITENEVGAVNLLEARWSLLRIS